MTLSQGLFNVHLCHFPTFRGWFGILLSIIIYNNLSDFQVEHNQRELTFKCVTRHDNFYRYLSMEIKCFTNTHFQTILHFTNHNLGNMSAKTIFGCATAWMMEGTNCRSAISWIKLNTNSQILRLFTHLLLCSFWFLTAPIHRHKKGHTLDTFLLSNFATACQPTLTRVLVDRSKLLVDC